MHCGVEAYMSITASVPSPLCVAAMPPVSPASSEPVFGAATSLSPMDTAPVNTRGRHCYEECMCTAMISIHLSIGLHDAFKKALLPRIV